MMRRASLLAAAILVLAACDTGDQQPEAPPAEEPEPDDAATEEDAAAEEPEPDDAAAENDAAVTEDDDAAADEDAAESPEIEMLGPPSDEIGVPVSFDPVVFEGEDAVVALAGMTVYREGVEVHVAVRWDPDGEGQSPQADPGGPLDARNVEDPPASEEDLPDELLTVELVHPDGEVASTVDSLLAMASGEEPQEPVLETFSGMGDETSWDQQLWTYPLPASGDEPLQFGASWPEQGIDDQQAVDLDIEELEEATEQVVAPWG